MKVTQKNLSKIRYIEDDQLFCHKSNLVQIEEIKQVANYNLTSSEDWSNLDHNIEELKDTIDLQEKLPSHPNPNIFFKHLDTLRTNLNAKNIDGEKKNKLKQNDLVKDKDHHLLLPLGKEEYDRMDSGGSSGDRGGFGKNL